MEDAIVLDTADDPQSGAAHPRTLRQFWLSPRTSYLLGGLLTILFFVADLLLPRGATVAIGYCVVPAVAAGARRRGGPLVMTALCTVLTWIALFVEPGEYAAWKSVFDRAMVTGILWFSLLLVVRRTTVIRVLLHQKQVLTATARELERSNAELANFASVVAHDLRGPLNSIGLHAQLLAGADAVKADPECGESVRSIRAELTRMGGFIQSLLIYGRVGSGALKIGDCDCEAVLRDVRQNLKADLQRDGAEVEHDPLPVVRADPVLITQLLQNLIENGIKYRGDAPPRVHVSCTQRPDSWLFAVRDNGIGIRPEDADRIFKPFHQAANARRTTGGVGLGLATCKRIVERHGGTLGVQSTFGDGSTFLFTIPRPPTEPAAANPSGPPPTPSPAV